MNTLKKLTLVSLIVAHSMSVAQTIPGTISYQGILMQTDGITPLADGPHTIVFKFYAVASGGTALTGLDRTVTITTTKGLFTCIIGGGTTPNAPFSASDMNQLGSQQIYIGITVDGGSELTPRAQTTPATYALQAQSANTISDNAITSSKIADGSIVNADINAGAAIVDTKLATISTAGKVSGNAITTGTISGNTNMNTTGNVTASSFTGNGSTLTAIGSLAIQDGSIVNDDINASAAIADSKLATISTAGKVSGNSITSGTIGGSTVISTSGDLLTTGKMGAGVSTPVNKLDVEGGAVIGATYSGTNTAPSNGLLIEGNVGIGVPNPTSKLSVSGTGSFTGVSTTNLTATYITTGRLLVNYTSSSVDTDAYMSVGNTATASGNGAVAIGTLLDATADFSTAMGTGMTTGTRGGSFVIGDASSFSGSPPSADNQMVMRFSGGYRLFTNSSMTVGMQMVAGGSSWSIMSDSTKKENLRAVDGESFLKKIRSFKLSSWNYKGQDPKIFRHYGPMAQDFFAAFGHDGVGTIGNDSLISSADFDGINFIAIQALEKRTTDLQKAVDQLQELGTKIDALIAENSRLKESIHLLEGEKNRKPGNKSYISVKKDDSRRKTVTAERNHH